MPDIDGSAGVFGPPYPVGLVPAIYAPVVSVNTTPLVHPTTRVPVIVAVTLVQATNAPQAVFVKSAMSGASSPIYVILLHVLGVQDVDIMKLFPFITTVKVIPNPNEFNSFSIRAIIPGVAVSNVIGAIAFNAPFTFTPVSEYEFVPLIVTEKVLLFVNHACYFHGSSKILNFRMLCLLSSHWLFAPAISS